MQWQCGQEFHMTWNRLEKPIYHLAGHQKTVKYALTKNDEICIDICLKILKYTKICTNFALQ